MDKIDLPVKRHGALTRLKKRLTGKTYIRPYFHEKHCIFVHVPKAAGTSVKKTLFPGTTGPGHRLAMDYYLEDPVVFDSYYVFAFVRNPYDRLVSAYNYLMQGGKVTADKRFRDTYLLEYEDFSDFVRRGLAQPDIAGWWHFMPQHLFLVDFEGKVIVDFVGRVEAIDADFAVIANHLGLDVTLPHDNQSERKDFRSYFDEETRAIAKEFYQKDFELFGYDVDW